MPRQEPSLLCPFSSKTQTSWTPEGSQHHVLRKEKGMNQVSVSEGQLRQKYRCMIHMMRCCLVPFKGRGNERASLERSQAAPPPASHPPGRPQLLWRHKWMVPRSLLGRETDPHPRPRPWGGEQSADFHLSWPSPTRSRASCFVPSQHLCQHVASSAFGQTAVVAQASAASPVLGRQGDMVTCCLHLPPPHFWWELQGSREHLCKNPDNLLAPRAGLPGLP